ncbi:MAG: hypothetical protein KKF42_05215, partial [Actinobacteria bacterium]|nr:hypothetical protein [Actinomycetota bacterium]
KKSFIMISMAYDVAGDGQLVGRCAIIAGGVVEDEVFEMDEFAVDPQRGAGVGKLRSFEEARADWRTGDALVETRERDAGVKGRPYQGCHADFRDIVSH